MSLRNWTTSFETGLMRTCFWPLRSALTMLRRQSAKTFIFTIEINLLLFNRIDADQQTVNPKIQQQFDMNILQSLSSPPAKFKETCDPQQRWKKHLAIVKGNPNHVSIVIQKAVHSNLVMKKPYLLFGLQKNCTLHELRENIRKVLELKEKDSLFVYCRKFLPNNMERIKNLQRFMEPDGFIYFLISEQETFG